MQSSSTLQGGFSETTSLEETFQPLLHSSATETDTPVLSSNANPKSLCGIWLAWGSLMGHYVFILRRCRWRLTEKIMTDLLKQKVKHNYRWDSKCELHRQSKDTERSWERQKLHLHLCWTTIADCYNRGEHKVLVLSTQATLWNSSIFRTRLAQCKATSAGYIHINIPLGVRSAGTAACFAHQLDSTSAWSKRSHQRHAASRKAPCSAAVLHWQEPSCARTTAA